MVFAVSFARVRSEVQAGLNENEKNEFVINYKIIKAISVYVIY